VFVYRGYEITKLPAQAGGQWDHYYAIRFGGIEVHREPTMEFAMRWVDQTQARFERLQTS
jgi:hypothetical protein